MSDELNQGVGVGETASGETDSAVSASPGNEQSAAIEQPDLNTGVEGSPTSTDAQLKKEGEGDDSSSSQPVDLSEQELATLPPKTAQAFARFRTENKGLAEENTTLKQQLAEVQQTQPEQPGIIVNNPVEDWDGLEQFNSLPAPYKEKLGDEIGWQRLPDLVTRAADNFEQLPDEWKDAIGHPILTAIGREFGLTPQGVIQAIQAGIGQGGNGETISPSPTAQSSQSQLANQLVETGGYERTDPLVQGVAGLERDMGQLRKENAALLSRLDKYDQQQQASTKEQQERSSRQLETDFQAKLNATQETILTPALKTIPQGYERYKRTVEVEAKEALAADSVAQNHLANAKAALLQAQKYRSQGTPELASQAEDRQSRELTAYAARMAVVTQGVLKDINALITENISLKAGVSQQQQQRKDLIGGNGAMGAGNGAGEPRRRDPQTGQWLETVEEYVERNAAARRARTAEMNGQR